MLPYLALGLTAGTGRNSGYDQLRLALPATDFDGRTRNYAPFMLVTVPQRPWSFTGLAGYSVSRGYVNYVNTIPERAALRSQSSMVQGGADYRLTPELKLGASLDWNHTFTQEVGAFEVEMPRDWAIAGVRATYNLTADVELNLNANTWLNESYSHQHITLGLSYKL